MYIFFWMTVFEFLYIINPFHFSRSRVTVPIRSCNQKKTRWPRLSILSYSSVTYSDFQYPDFTWERQTQGVILGAFFYGYIFTQIPGGYLATKFGGKRIFLIGIAATSVMTLLTPFLTHRGIGFLITTRVLEGLFEVRTTH